MSSVRSLVTPEKLLRPEVLALHAYHVPPASGMIKLDAMENPYLLPQTLRDEIARLVADAEINRYPDAAARELKTAICKVTNLSTGMDSNRFFLFLLLASFSVLLQHAAPGRPVAAG